MLASVLMGGVLDHRPVPLTFAVRDRDIGVPWRLLSAFHPKRSKGGHYASLVLYAAVQAGPPCTAA